MKIRISADSTCDLSPEYIERHHINIIPLAVSMGGRDYTDGLDITPSPPTTSSATWTRAATCPRPAR